MSKKSKGVNPDLEAAVSELLKAVMSDDMASLTDKCKVIDRAINIEKLKQKISDDEWGSGFIALEDDEGQNMIPLSFKGDKYGCNYSHSPSIKNHLRPLDNHYGTYSFQRYVRMDNVESHVGTGDNSSYIRSILLPYSQHQREEQK